jgi:hypothetical protein
MKGRENELHARGIIYRLDGCAKKKTEARCDLTQWFLPYADFFRSFPSLCLMVTSIRAVPVILLVDVECYCSCSELIAWQHPAQKPDTGDLGSPTDKPKSEVKATKWDSDPARNKLNSSEVL